MQKKKSIKRMMYIILGCAGAGVGAVGAVFPVLPSFPFLLMAAVCFGKGSEKLERWFKGTKLYKNNLESFARGQGMTWKTKIHIMITMTVIIGASFTMMFIREVYVPCAVLAVVWLFHIFYFCFGVKKYEAPKEAEIL